MGEAGDERSADAPDLPASGSAAEMPDGRPNAAQMRYLRRGLTQAGGKLPLFDEYGQHTHPALVRAYIVHGWAEPWFGNPMKTDSLVCKLTAKGRRVLGEPTAPR